MDLCELVKNQRKVPRGDAATTVKSVFAAAIEEMSEIFVLTDTDG